METIRFNVKSTFFEKVKNGKTHKLEREVTPKNEKRYCQIDKYGLCAKGEEGEDMYLARHYDVIEFQDNTTHEVYSLLIKECHLYPLIGEDECFIQYKYGTIDFVAKVIEFSF